MRPCMCFRKYILYMCMWVHASINSCFLLLTVFDLFCCVFVCLFGVGFLGGSLLFILTYSNVNGR